MDLVLLAPEISLAISAVLVVLLDLFVERKGWLVAISLIGLAVSVCFSIGLLEQGPQLAFNNMLAVDGFAVFFKILFPGVAALVILGSTDYASKFSRFQGEYYALILTSTLGMMLMASAIELISLFVSLELVNLSLYALAGFLRGSKSTEASLKYLLLSSIASAILLFGMALVYGFTGSTHLGEIARTIQSTLALHELASAGMVSSIPGLLLGVVMMIAGFGFKVAVVPFHMWVPDVYEGSPTTITAYLSTAGKAAGVAIILRVFYSAFQLPEGLSQNWGMIFAVLSAITMTVGNIVAIQQTNIKRMLGYSSIAQIGYITVGLAATGFSSNPSATQSSILFFLMCYALTNLGAFLAIIAITQQIDSDNIDDFSGIGRRSPLVGLALSLAMISLIGIPPAAGFMAKFYIFSMAVQQGLLWLVIIAVLNSVLSAFYYLRVVRVMWMKESNSKERIEASLASNTALLISSVGVLLLGITPALGMNLARLAALLGL